MGSDILILEASFGIYGSLPILVVWYEDGYFMIDGTNGIVAGPYLDGVEFNPGGLLLGHAEYEPGTGFAVIDSSGCDTSGLGPRWRKNPPPGFNPGSVQPVSPTVPIPSPALVWPPATPLDFPTEWWEPSQYKYAPPRKDILPAPPAILPYMPDVPGQPTHWQCITLGGAQQGKEACSILEIICPTGGGTCSYRQITCHFDVVNNPSKNGQPPADPGPPITYDYPSWPDETTGSNPDNGNDCTERVYH